MINKIFGLQPKEDKIPEELKGSWYEESLRELDERVLDQEKINKELKMLLWDEMAKSKSLHKIEDKVVEEGSANLNELECLLVGVVKI